MSVCEATAQRGRAGPHGPHACPPSVQLPPKGRTTAGGRRATARSQVRDQGRAGQAHATSIVRSRADGRRAPRTGACYCLLCLCAHMHHPPHELAASRRAGGRAFVFVSAKLTVWVVMSRGAGIMRAHAQSRVASLLRPEVRTTWAVATGQAGGGMACHAMPCHCVCVQNLPPSLGRFDSAWPLTSLMSVYYS